MCIGEVVGGKCINGAQEVGGILIGEDRLVEMAGAELVKWYQIH